MTLDSQKPIKKLGNRERARFWMTRAFSPIFLSLSLFAVLFLRIHGTRRIFSTNVIHLRGIMTRLARAQRVPFNEQEEKKERKKGTTDA